MISPPLPSALDPRAACQNVQAPVSIAAYSPREMMIVVASRLLQNDDVCLAGIGVPSAACNLARQTHAPRLHLIYESGTIGASPTALPLSIGDGELCETALTTVPLPELFRYWLQGGRITIGFLGGAQIDRYANLNTTVIGEYDHPLVRLPGAGGAPEIATSCSEVFIIMEFTRERFVDNLSFVTSLGHGKGWGDREAMGVRTKGPTKVITDLCTLEPDENSKELVVTSIHPDVDRMQLIAQCGWPLKFADDLVRTPPPTMRELGALRDLNENTAKAHRLGA